MCEFLFLRLPAIVFRGWLAGWLVWGAGFWKDNGDV